jgi:K+-transporting ATPase c subunit
VEWTSGCDKKTSGRWKKVAQSFAEKSELDAKKSVPADCYVYSKSELDAQKISHEFTNKKHSDLFVHFP